MVSFLRALIIIAVLAMSSCSKLGDSSADGTVAAPAPIPSFVVTVPDPDHQWGFENTGNDTGSVGGWDGSFTGAANYTTTMGEFKVGTAAAKLPEPPAMDFQLVRKRFLPAQRLTAPIFGAVVGSAAVNPFLLEFFMFKLGLGFAGSALAWCANVSLTRLGITLYLQRGVPHVKATARLQNRPSQTCTI